MKPEVETKAGGRKPKSKTRLIVVLVIIGVVVVGMVVATKMFLLSSGPDQIVRQYIVAESTNDYATMRRLLTKDSTSLVPPSDQQPKQAKQAKLPEMTIGEPVIKGNRATVPVKVREEVLGNYVGDQNLTIVLAKENGQWKVDLRATVMERYKQQFGNEMGGPMGEAAPEETPPTESTPPAESAPAPAKPNAR